MADNDQLRQDLLGLIETRRSGVRRFLRENQPAIRRRTTAALVLSSLAAVFTAGPALGGENFVGAVQQTLGLAQDSTVWRVLCLAALLVSVGAAVMANLGKTQEAAVGRLSAAEAARAELEGLRTLVQFGQISVEDGAKPFQQYSVSIPFIEDGPVPASARPGPPPAGDGPQPAWQAAPPPEQPPPSSWQGPPTMTFPRPTDPPPPSRRPPPPSGRPG